MSFKLTVLGCGSAIPSVVNRPTSQLLNINERFFLIDCGEGTQIQLKKYGFNLQRINHIFISHLHGDHYFGLIGLMSTMHLLGRKKELHIYAHEELKKIIELQLLGSNTILNFPFFFHSLPEDSEYVLFEDNQVIVENILLDHTIKCSGFIFKEKKNERKINRDMVDKLNIPFNKLKSIQYGADWIDPNGNIIKNQDITTKNSSPNTFAFCTDTRYNKAITHRIKGVDLLYHETTFKEESSIRAYETGHSTTYQAANIAKKARVKRLMIGHISQRYHNKEDVLVEVKKVFQDSILAESGLKIDFNKII